MDFALNSLTSPAMVAATLASLAPNGRLAEISKRDIWSPQRVAQERPDVAYNLIAIDFLSPEVPSASLFITTARSALPRLLAILLQLVCVYLLCCRFQHMVLKVRHDPLCRCYRAISKSSPACWQLDWSSLSHL